MMRHVGQRDYNEAVCNLVPGPHYVQFCELCDESSNFIVNLVDAYDAKGETLAHASSLSNRFIATSFDRFLSGEYSTLEAATGSFLIAMKFREVKHPCIVNLAELSGRSNEQIRIAEETIVISLDWNINVTTGISISNPFQYIFPVHFSAADIPAQLWTSASSCWIPSPRCGGPPSQRPPPSSPSWRRAALRCSPSPPRRSARPPLSSPATSSATPRPPTPCSPPSPAPARANAPRSCTPPAPSVASRRRRPRPASARRTGRRPPRRRRPPARSARAGRRPTASALPRSPPAYAVDAGGPAGSLPRPRARSRRPAFRLSGRRPARGERPAVQLGRSPRLRGPSLAWSGSGLTGVVSD
jgi:hypothetical protein